MNKKKILIILVIAFVLIAIGAGVAIGMGNVKESSDKIVLKQGKTTEIILEENPSTGYMWTVAVPGDGVVEIVEDNYVAGLEMPGAAGSHIWTIKGLEKGETQLVFQYSRSWEENGVIEEKTFNIVVK